MFGGPEPNRRDTIMLEIQAVSKTFNAGTPNEVRARQNVSLTLASHRGQRRGLGWILNARFRLELRERVRTLNMGLENRLDNAIGSLSMQQAVNLGDRIVMMHRGKLMHDLHGSERQRVRVDDLLERFEEVRRRDQLDPAVAEMLRQDYI